MTKVTDKGAQVGDRVRLIHTSDPFTSLKPGAEGTVKFGPDAMGTIHIEWDDGSNLGMVPGQDSYTVIERRCRVE